MSAIHQLVVLAGPSASGKSTFLKRLTRNELSDVLPDFGDLSTWTIGHRKNVDEVLRLSNGRVIYRFDIFASLKASIRGSDDPFEELHEVIASADEAACYTLWVTGANLAGRLGQRYEAMSDKRRRQNESRGTYHVLESIYADGASVLRLYDSWFQHASSLGFKEHWIIDNNDLEIEMSEAHSWPALRAGELAALGDELTKA